MIHTLCPGCNKEISNNNWKRHESKCFGTGEYTVWNSGLSVKNNPELADKLMAGPSQMRETVKAGITTPGRVKYICSDEGRKAKSEWRKKLHEENPEAHPNRRLAGNRSKMSYPERLVFDALTQAGVDFQHNKKLDKFFPDFVIGKQIIEVDGAKWHDSDYDARRDARLVELGYAVERFEVGNQKDLVERVKTFLAIN